MRSETCNGTRAERYGGILAVLLLVLGNWGKCPGCAADLDGSGDVGILDFLLVLAQWGPCR